MKKFFFFLIGFSLPFVFYSISFAYSTQYFCSSEQAKAACESYIASSAYPANIAVLQNSYTYMNWHPQYGNYQYNYFAFPNDDGSSCGMDGFSSCQSGVCGCSDTDNDGVCDDDDLCPDTLPGVVVDSTGCIPDSDGDGVKDDTDLCPDTPANVVVNYQGCADGDADGDGILDQYDIYPYDPNYQTYQIVIKYYNSSDEMVAATIKTEKGDTFTYGSTADSVRSEIKYSSEVLTNTNEPVFSSSAGSSAGDGSGDGAGGSGGSGTAGAAAAAAAAAAAYASAGSEVPVSGAASGVGGGETVSGSEVDNELLEKVVTNTATSNSNDQVLADYMDAMNKNLAQIRAQGELDSTGLTGVKSAVESGNSTLSAIDNELGSLNTAVGTVETAVNNLGSGIDNVNSGLSDIKDSIIGEGGLSEQVGKVADTIDNQEITDGKAGWNGAGGSDYTDSNFGTSFTEGTDYTKAPELSEQSWLTNFIASNPLKTALDASGIESSGSCSFNVAFGPPLGSHEIDICGLESGFDVAGGVLYGLSILLSLVMIARGF